MAYLDVVLADLPQVYYRLGEPSGTTAFDYLGNIPSYYLQEDGVSRYILEDGSGFYLLDHGLNGVYEFSPTLGATGALGTSGDSDTAASFDGISQYVSIPNNPVLALGDGPLSVECWFRRLGNFGVNYNYLLSKGNTFGLEFDSTNKLLFDQDGAVQATTSTVFSSDTGFHHCLAVHDAGAVKQNKIYIDGIDVAVTGSDSLFQTNTVPMAIAAYWDGSNPGNLAVDEVAVYNYALTSVQAAAHFAAGTTAPAAAVGAAYVGGGYYP